MIAEKVIDIGADFCYYCGRYRRLLQVAAIALKRGCMGESPALGPNPTIADVARAAGVSTATVSRALNHRPDVAVETREHVESVASQLGYRGRYGYRRRGRRAIRHITLLAHAIDNEYIGTICSGITDQLDPSAHQLLLLLTKANARLEAEYVRLAKQTGADGILVVTPRLSNREFCDLLDDDTACVLIDFYPDTPSLPCIRATNWQGAREATNYLISLGHRRIGFIAGRRSDQITESREHGYRSALVDAHIPYSPELTADGDYAWASGFRAGKKLLALDAPPTAIFACSDLMAFGAIEAVHAAGLRVPDDISVVGFDDLPIAAEAYPPLTTMRQPLYEMGRMAAQMIVSLIDGEDVVSRQIELPTRLVIRQSCRALT
jgi:LacI family transcriptional regulator